jgi:predicted nucleic acid-binding protein
MENIFVDTSAIYALIDTDQPQSIQASTTWLSILEKATPLVTNNYVLVETTALLQSRHGIEAVQNFQKNIMPYLQVAWVDENMHTKVINDLLSINRKSLSLVDCSCFETMRLLGIKSVFTFDNHFREQGFTLIP